MSKPATRLLLPLILLLLTGCSPLVRPEQTARSEFITLRNGDLLGQTFTARLQGLMGIDVYLRGEAAQTEFLTLRLHSDPLEASTLAVSSLPSSILPLDGFARFPLSPQRDSINRDYYLTLEVTGSGEVQVGSAAGPAYLNGALYKNGEARDAQLTFRLVYDPWQTGLGLARLAISWLGILAVGFFLFAIPGWALLALLWPEWRILSWIEKLALAVGVSLALYPLLILWTNLVGLRLGPVYAWLPPSVGIAIFGFRWLLRRPAMRSSEIHPREWLAPFSPRKWLCATRLPDLVMFALLALIFAVRFWVIRTLDAPLWGDSLIHTTIAQLISDHGGLFDSWQPYAELQSFTYHFGFHSLVSAFHWITGRTMPRATLWVGQLLNGLAVISLYPLTLRVGRSRWSGVFATLLAGLLFSMPMYYLNWGRYTQLAGQVILPVAVYLLWATLDQDTPRFDWRAILLCGLALGGLALTHYRLILIAACFLLAYAALSLGKLRSLAIRMTAIAIIAGFAFLPWFLHLSAGKMLSAAAPMLQSSSATSWVKAYNAIGDLFFYLPVWAWLLFPLCLGWGLWQQQRGTALIGLWWLIVFVAANPQWFRLPGEGVLSNFAVFIAAYIPVGILLSPTLGWLPDRIDSFGGKRFALRSLTQITLGLILLAAGLWGARQRVNDLHTNTSILLTRPDLRAFAWIRANSPQNARFLVNSFFAYGGSVVVGSDGGWWLPLLTGRSSSLPPINYETEIGPRRDYRQWVNQLVAEIRSQGLESPAVLDMLEARGLTHVYIGQLQGQVNSDSPLFTAEQLLNNPYFRPIYHQDRVWIFERR